MKNLLLILVVCVSLIGCSKKENLIRKSKKAYENKLMEISTFSCLDNDQLRLSAYLTDLRIEKALLIHDTVLYKIHLIEKEKYDSIELVRSNKFNKLRLELDSLLKNDTILIERGILISDDEYEIDLKFDYFKKNNK